MKDLIAIGSQAAQSRPAVTTAVNVLTGQGNTGPRLEVYRIVVAEVGGAGVNWSIFHDIDGTTYDENTALWFENALAANTTFEWTAQYPGGGIPIGKNGSFGVQVSTANRATFTFYTATAPTDERAVRETRHG